MSGLTADWLAGIPEPSRAWLDAHPAASDVLDAFAEQGFSDCADLIGLMLPAACIQGQCECAPGPGGNRTRVLPKVRDARATAADATIAAGPG